MPLLLQRFFYKKYVPYKFGSLAQLVQSTCLTSRGSLVRTQYLPQRKALQKCEAFLF